MAILIDAYNVLHCTHTMPAWCALNTAADMCRYLESSRFADQRCVVVCDGAPKPLERDYSGPVELRYSGHASDADTVIERLILADHSPRQLIVVSNDRRLMTAARRRRARAMTSETFLHLLITPNPRNLRHDAKPAAIANPDYWLEQFQITDDEDFTEPDSPPQAPTSTVEPPAAAPPAEAPADTSGASGASGGKPRPGETEIDYWLRVFGFKDEDKTN